MSPSISPNLVFFRKDFDPKGERTVGVLTKLDNLNSSTDKKRVSEILENKTKYLNLGKFTNPQSLIVMFYVSNADAETSRICWCCKSKPGGH